MAVSFSWGGGCFATRTLNPTRYPQPHPLLVRKSTSPERRQFGIFQGLVPESTSQSASPEPSTPPGTLHPPPFPGPTEGRRPLHDSNKLLQILRTCMGGMRGGRFAIRQPRALNPTRYLQPPNSHGARVIKLSWREAGPPNYRDDKVDFASA